MRGRRVATAAVRMSASKEGKPRSHSGGRSPRHALRHAARGHARTFAPSWTDATAFAVLGALHDGSVVAGVGITQHTLGVLGSSRARAAFLGSLRLCADDRAVAAAILLEHSSRLQAVQGVAEKKAAVRNRQTHRIQAPQYKRNANFRAAAGMDGTILPGVVSGMLCRGLRVSGGRKGMGPV